MRARVRQGRGGGGERCIPSRYQPACPLRSPPQSGSLCCGRSCRSLCAPRLPLNRSVTARKSSAGASRWSVCTGLCTRRISACETPDRFTLWLINLLKKTRSFGAEKGRMAGMLPLPPVLPPWTYRTASEAS